MNYGGHDMPISHIFGTGRAAKLRQLAGSTRAKSATDWLQGIEDGMQRFLDSRLSLRQLRAIETIDRCGSLSQAAIALGMTQSALSKSLHEAENILQLKIFDRSARGVARSVHGDGAVNAAKSILATLRRLEDELDRSLEGSSYTVAIGALSTAALGLLPRLLPSIMGQRQELQVRIVEGLTGDLLVQLSSGEIDFVVGRTYRSPGDERFVVERLYTEPLAVMARPGHPLFTDNRAELLHFEAVLPTYSERFGPEIEAFAAKVGLRPSNLVRSGSVGFLCEILQSSDTVTVLPVLMVAGQLQRGELRTVPVSVEQPERPGGLIWPAERPRGRGVELLANMLREGIKRLTVDGAIIRPYRGLGEKVE